MPRGLIKKGRTQGYRIKHAQVLRQLIEKRSIPAKPGSLEREDYEYRRWGVVDLFAAFDPLTCKRVVKLTSNRTAVDFAHFLRELVDIHHSHCEKLCWSWTI